MKMKITFLCRKWPFLQKSTEEKMENNPFSNQLLVMKQKTIIYSETSSRKLRICRFQNIPSIRCNIINRYINMKMKVTCFWRKWHFWPKMTKNNFFSSEKKLTSTTTKIFLVFCIELHTYKDKIIRGGHNSFWSFFILNSPYWSLS